MVFDCVGIPGSLQLALDSAPFDARVVVAGRCMAADRVYPANALTKELTLAFAFVYRKRDFEIVIDMLDAERIVPRNMISDRVGLNSCPGPVRGAQGARRSDQR